VLETTNASTLQLRVTAAGGFYDFGFIYPASCVGGTPGSATMVSAFRFGTAVGDTLSATLCNEGSTMLVTVVDAFSGGSSTQFRCTRATSNHNVCQRLF
jgi:hypothetical protein